ncbi:MAG: TetR family transcriptional regulator [Tardiphaga sp.]|jgi:AcrR family transcriptional regulator|nr:TetR family transcriptional regulator [Tardiphaga sp.]
MWTYDAGMKAPPASRNTTTVKPPAGAKAKSAQSTYHHGDLHEALLKAAEKLLERDGLQGLTLRAVAREAGVSHAAPTHHFGDLAGLVSELAAIGFRSFNATMIAAAATGTTPVESALARARAYLAYARTRPGMYRLMFRTERLDMTRPALREAANASFAALATVSGTQHPGDVATDALTMDQAAQIARTWSLVHGFTMLMLDGRLGDILRRIPDGADAETLFLEMLKITIARPL